ncbi:hypothetical protein A3Q56_00667 [Intoshia linei]|uniref:PI3K/PI4K catalytic domain-containing protein n=1 Tax=Intoshia linei TaxID=1819745 RepID=A0A177BB09_9BILA|nr:hypothetical protein A3Q56_00667 [Intoshia linei]
MKNISISTKSLLTSYEPENKNVNVIIYSRFLTAINITFSDPVSCRDVIKAIVNKMRNVPYMQRDIEYDLKELGTNTFFNSFKIDYYKLMNVCNTLLTFIKHEKGNHIPNKTCLNALRIKETGVGNKTLIVILFEHTKNLIHHCVIRYKMILSCPKLDSRPTQFLFTNLHFVIDSISRMPSKYSMGTPKLHVDVVYGSINIEHEVLDIPINDYAYSRNFLPINKQCVMRKSLIRNLPLETSIQLTICFCDVNSNWKMFSGSTPLFNTKSELKQGIEIIGMFEYEEGYDMGFTGNNYFNDSSLTITIEFESHPFDVVYSCEKMISTFNEFSSRYVDQNLIVSPKYNLGIPMEILNFSKYMKNPNSEVCEKLNYLIKTQKMSINLALEIINEKYVSYFLRNTAFNTLVSHFKEFSDYIHIFVKEIIVNMADIPYSLKWVTNKANDDVFFANYQPWCDQHNTTPSIATASYQNIGADREGDNLKYDRVVMTITKEINKMWRNEGFDIDLITYNILPVDYFSGIIEIVKNASSLRQIEGVTGGVFNEKCINTFLQNYNPSENEMLNAYERFFKSLAGYCVIMYIVGAGDRHNDNIMIKTDGQLFHIDFGKVFGDKQKFVNINRNIDEALSAASTQLNFFIHSIASFQPTKGEGDTKSLSYISGKHSLLRDGMVTSICCTHYTSLELNKVFIINIRRVNNVNTTIKRTYQQIMEFYDKITLKYENISFPKLKSHKKAKRKYLEGIIPTINCMFAMFTNDYILRKDDMVYEFVSSKQM